MDTRSSKEPLVPDVMPTVEISLPFAKRLTKPKTLQPIKLPKSVIQQPSMPDFSRFLPKPLKITTTAPKHKEGYNPAKYKIPTFQETKPSGQKRLTGEVAKENWFTNMKISGFTDPSTIKIGSPEDIFKNLPWNKTEKPMNEYSPAKMAELYPADFAHLSMYLNSFGLDATKYSDKIKDIMIAFTDPETRYDRIKTYADLIDTFPDDFQETTSQTFTPASSSTTINAPNNMSQYDPLIVKYAKMYGVTDDQMTEFRKIAYAIMWQESGGNPDAIANTEKEHSLGLFQLNTMGGQGSGYTDSYLRDPENNIALGLKHIVPAFLKNAGQYSGGQLVHFVAMGSGHPGYDATNFDASAPYIEKYNQLTISGGVVADDTSTEDTSGGWFNKGFIEPIQKLKTTFTTTIKPLSSPFQPGTEVMSETPFKFILPDGAVTSQFGANDVDIRKGEHTGVDLGLVPGSPVNVVATGTVISVGENAGFGNEILIEHKVGDQTFYTQYAHLRGFTVSVGDQVVEGQNIGISGGVPGEPGAGTTTGPHLHFGVKVDGQWIDPVAFLQKAGGAMVTANSAASQIQSLFKTKETDALELGTIKILQQMGGYQIDPASTDPDQVASDVFNFMMKDILPQPTVPSPEDAPEGYYQDQIVPSGGGKLNAPGQNQYQKVINPRYLPSLLTEEQIWEMVKPSTTYLPPEQMDRLRHTAYAASDQIRYSAKIALDELMSNWYFANPSPTPTVSSVLEKTAAFVGSLGQLDADIGNTVIQTIKATANHMWLTGTGRPNESPFYKAQAAASEEDNFGDFAKTYLDTVVAEGEKLKTPTLRFDGSHGVGRPGEQFLNFEIPFTDKKPLSVAEDSWKGLIPDGIAIGIDEVGEQLFSPSNLIPLGAIDNAVSGMLHSSGSAIGKVTGGLSTAAWKNIRKEQSSRVVVKTAEYLFPERKISEITPDEYWTALEPNVNKWADARKTNPNVTFEDVFTKEVKEPQWVPYKKDAAAAATNPNMPTVQRMRKTTVTKNVPDENLIDVMKLTLLPSVTDREFRILANDLNITRVGSVIKGIKEKVGLKTSSTVSEIGTLEKSYILDILDHRTVGTLSREDAIANIQTILKIPASSDSYTKIGRWLDAAEQNNLWNDIFVKEPTTLIDKRALAVDAWVNRITNRPTIGKKTFKAAPATFENMARAIGENSANLWERRQSALILQHRKGMNIVAENLFKIGESSYKHVWQRALAPYFKLQSKMVLTFPGYVIGNIVEDAVQAYIHSGSDAYGIFHNQFARLQDEFPDSMIASTIMDHFRPYEGNRSILRSREVYDPTRLGGLKDVKSRGIIAQAVDTFSTATGATALHNYNSSLSKTIRSNAMLKFIQTEKKKALQNFVVKAGPEMQAFIRAVETSIPIDIPDKIRTAMSGEILSIMHKPNAEQLISRIYEKYTGRALAPKMIDKIMAQHPDLIPPGARKLIRDWTRSNDITNVYAFDRFLEVTVRPKIYQERLETEFLMHDSLATHINALADSWKNNPPNSAMKLMSMERELEEAFIAVSTFPDRLMSYPYRMGWASDSDMRKWYDMVTSVMEGSALDPNNPHLLTASRWETLVNALTGATEKSAEYWKNMGIDPTYIRSRAARYREESETISNLWRQEAKELKGLHPKSDEEMSKWRSIRSKYQTQIANEKTRIEAKYADNEFRYRQELVKALGKDLTRDGITKWRSIGVALEKVNPNYTPSQIKSAFEAVTGGTSDAYFAAFPERRLWRDTSETLLNSDELGWSELGKKLNDAMESFYKESNVQARAKIEKDINKYLDDAMKLDSSKFSVHFEQAIDELHDPMRFKSASIRPNGMSNDQWVEQQINSGHVLDDAFGSDPDLVEERWTKGGHSQDAWAGYYSSMQDAAWNLMHMSSKELREGLLDGSISVRRVDKTRLAEDMGTKNSIIDSASQNWQSAGMYFKTPIPSKPVNSPVSMNMFYAKNPLHQIGFKMDVGLWDPKTSLLNLHGSLGITIRPGANPQLDEFLKVIPNIEVRTAPSGIGIITTKASIPDNQLDKAFAEIEDFTQAFKDLYVNQNDYRNIYEAFDGDILHEKNLPKIDVKKIDAFTKKYPEAAELLKLDDVKAFHEAFTSNLKKIQDEVRQNLKATSGLKNVDQLINDAMMYRRYVEDNSVPGLPLFRGEKWLKSELAADPISAAIPEVQTRWNDYVTQKTEVWDGTSYLQEYLNNNPNLQYTLPDDLSTSSDLEAVMARVNSDYKYYQKQYEDLLVQARAAYPVEAGRLVSELESRYIGPLQFEEELNALVTNGTIDEKIRDEITTQLLPLIQNARVQKTDIGNFFNELGGLRSLMVEHEGVTKHLQPLLDKIGTDLPDDITPFLDQEVLSKLGINPNPRAQKIGSLKVGDKLEFSLASTTRNAQWADEFAAGLTSSAPRQPGEKVAVVYHFDQNTPSYQIPNSLEEEHMIAGSNFIVTHIEHKPGSLNPNISHMASSAPDDVMHIYLQYKEQYLVTKSIDKPLTAAYPKLNSKQYGSMIDKFKVANPRSVQALSAPERMVQYATAALQNKSIYAHDNLAGMLTPARLNRIDPMVNDVISKLKAGAASMSKHPISSPDYHNSIMTYAKAMTELFRKVKSTDRGKADLNLWKGDVENAAQEALKKYYTTFTNYDEPKTLDYFMSHIFPFWTYESQRPVRLAHTLLQNPALLRQFIYYAGGSYNGTYRVDDDYRVDPFGGMMFSSIERYANARYLPPSQYGGILGQAHNMTNYLSRWGYWAPGASLGVDAWNAAPEFLGGNEDKNLMPSTLFGSSHMRTLLGLSAGVGSVSGIDALKEVPTKIYDTLGDDYQNWLVMNKLAEKGYIYDQVLVAAENGQKVSNTTNTESIDAKKLLSDTKAEMIINRTILQNLPLPGTAKYSPVEREDAANAYTDFIAKNLGIPAEKQREIISKYGKKYFTNLMSAQQEDQFSKAVPEQWTQNFTLPFKTREDQEFTLEVDKLYAELENSRNDFKSEKTILEGWLTSGHVANDPQVFDPKANSRLATIFSNPDFQKSFTEKDYRDALSKLRSLYKDVQKSIVLDYKQRGIPYTMEDWAAYNANLGRETPVLKHPYKLILDAYYDISPSDYHKADNPEETDWAAYQRQIDNFISLVPDEYKQQLIADINKNKSPIDKELDTASRALTEFNSLPRYEGLTIEQGELLHKIFLTKKALDDKKKNGGNWTAEERERYVQIVLKYGKTLSNLKQSSKRVIWLNTNPNAQLVYKWFLKDEPNEFVIDTVDKALQ